MQCIFFVTVVALVTNYPSCLLASTGFYWSDFLFFGFLALLENKY